MLGIGERVPDIGGPSAAGGAKISDNVGGGLEEVDLEESRKDAGESRWVDVAGDRMGELRRKARRGVEMEEGERGGERTRVVKRVGVRGVWGVWQAERGGEGGKD